MKENKEIIYRQEIKWLMTWQSHQTSDKNDITQMATGVDEKKQKLLFFHQQKVNLDQMISRGFCGYIAFRRGHEDLFLNEGLWRSLIGKSVKKKDIEQKKKFSPRREKRKMSLSTSKKWIECTFYKKMWYLTTCTK